MPPNNQEANIRRQRPYNHILTFVFEITIKILIIHSSTAVFSAADGNTDVLEQPPNVFKSLLLSGEIFVDKSIIISQFVYSRESFMIITRPSKWGKTTNLDMICTFLEAEVDEHGVYDPSEERNNHKFFLGGKYQLENNRTITLKKLKVTSAPGIMSAQGIFPVLKLQFGNIKRVKTYSEFLQQLFLPIQTALKSKQYLRKYYRKTNNLLDESGKEHLMRLFNENTTVTETDLKHSLKLLSRVLHSHRDTRVIVLIDDYDNVNRQAFEAFGAQSEEYKNITELMNDMYNITFSGNLHIRKALLTGQLMVPVKVKSPRCEEYSILKEPYTPYYGITNVEIGLLMKEFNGNEDDYAEIERWYSGYTYGGYDLFNLWSTLKSIKNDYKNQPYWANLEEERKVLDDRILHLDYVQEGIQKLMNGTELRMKVNQYVSHADLASSTPLLEDVFSMLLFQGYLNPVEVHPADDFTSYECVLSIPNEEMKMLFNSKLKPK